MDMDFLYNFLSAVFTFKLFVSSIYCDWSRVQCYCTQAAKLHAKEDNTIREKSFWLPRPKEGDTVHWLYYILLYICRRVIRMPFFLFTTLVMVRATFSGAWARHVCYA